MTWWEALILGIIQGVTEFFPSPVPVTRLGSMLGLQLPGVVFEVCACRHTCFGADLYRRESRACCWAAGGPTG